MQTHQEEKLWLVDKNDEPVEEGWQWRSHDLTGNWKNFRVVNAFVRRADGKLWIPRRASTKRIFPNCLDVSMGGHVEFGESYADAFARESQEEIGIDVSKVPVRLLGKLSPFDIEALSAFMNVWEIELEDVPNWNHDDFSEAYWLSPGELRDRIANGDKGKGDLLPILDAFYPSA